MKAFPIYPAEHFIPKGMYCYTTTEGKSGRVKTRKCPFWEAYDAKRHGPLPEGWTNPGDAKFEGAYCRYLREGDWTDSVGFSLLWDAVKECNINVGYEDDK